MTPRVREILSWYGSDNIGTLTNMARIFNTGRIGGSGKLVIYPVDQGFEHGPARSFAKNPDAYDPAYHFNLAIEAGCNAYAAPLGSLEVCARDYAGDIPLILKINNSDSLVEQKENPISALTSSVDDALRLGCAGIGFTIYPGSTERKKMYEEISEATREAKKAGLAVIIWAYPRGKDISKAGEQAVDVVTYAAQIACQLGANIVKVKPTTAHIEQAEAKKVFEANNIRVDDMASRTRHLVDSCFHGKRVVICSGGATKSTEEVLEECRGMAQGGAFGMIMGRNAFQRTKKDAIKLIHDIQDIFVGQE
jgi:fructose-bisphosphate aldolase, class I